MLRRGILRGMAVMDHGGYLKRWPQPAECAHQPSRQQGLIFGDQGGEGGAAHAT